MYYDYNKVLSYNAFFNFIIGERGVGKTYGWKKFVIKRFLKTGRQFAYIRRYATELEESLGNSKAPKFFEQVQEEFKGHKFEVVQRRKTWILKIDDKVAGYGLPLSTAAALKSTSYEKVDTIGFDEFIIDTNGVYHYLRNEVESFLDIIETIGRLRNNLRVFFLGNAISSTNPYFMFFDLGLPYGSDIKTYKDGLILVNYIKNEEYREIKKQTKFGRLIDGTDYSKYAIDNEFLRDSPEFIGKKSKKSKFFFIVKYGGSIYGVWLDYGQETMFISKDYDPNCPMVVALSPDDHDSSTLLIRVRNSSMFSTVIEHYRNGRLMFENQKVKNEFIKIIYRYL